MRYPRPDGSIDLSVTQLDATLDPLIDGRFQPSDCRRPQLDGLGKVGIVARTAGRKLVIDSAFAQAQTRAHPGHSQDIAGGVVFHWADLYSIG
jgi:hypothetical protein